MEKIFPVLTIMFILTHLTYYLMENIFHFGAVGRKFFSGDGSYIGKCRLRCPLPLWCSYFAA